MNKAVSSLFIIGAFVLMAIMGAIAFVAQGGMG